MQAQFIFNSGIAAFANVEKINIVKDQSGRIIDIKWTTPPDAYAELKYINPREVAAIVMIHDVEGQTPLSTK